MKTDIFEDMKERVGCEIFPTFLPQRMVWKSSSSTHHLIIQKNS